MSKTTRNRHRSGSACDDGDSTEKEEPVLRHEKDQLARGKSGFSLIELLVVIAIIAALSSFAILGFQNITSSRGVTQAASEVASILEFARSEAVTRQSYVWVAIQEATVDNSLEVQMAAVYSADGSTTGGTNLIPLSRVLTVQNAGLSSFTTLKSATRDLYGGSSPVTDLSTSVSGIVVKTFPKAEFLKKATVTFTPRGEAMLKGAPAPTDGFDPAIGIALVPARGTVKSAGPDEAGIVIDGSTGTAQILRL